MIGLKKQFPAYSLTAVDSADASKGFRTLTNDDFKGKWQVYFFWPKDFTFVCPTEIVAFSELKAEFESRGAKVIGCSIDSDYVHAAWREHHPELKNITFPWLSDIKRELSSELGILDDAAGVSLRATYIVDPDNVIRFVSVNDLAVGRNVEEVLRTLDALQSGALCPCNWKKGEATL